MSFMIELERISAELVNLLVGLGAESCKGIKIAITKNHSSGHYITLGLPGLDIQDVSGRTPAEARGRLETKLEARVVQIQEAEKVELAAAELAAKRAEAQKSLRLQARGLLDSPLESLARQAE